MGEVYRARDTRLGRDVAVKVLRAELTDDPERVGRFAREARAASALNHPNVVSLFDVGEHEGSPFLVTELLEGETLRERCGRGLPDQQEALSIAMQIAEGLAAAHEKGIVHRDLKPENVFLLPSGRVKVLDFGLAKLLDPEAGETGIDGGHIVVTTAGTVLGTVEYMSPEQMRGAAADHRTDLYALGAVLHEMLVGKTPFHRESATDTFQAILEEEPPSLAKCGVKAPPALQAVVKRCLAKRPEGRFQSADELVQALMPIATGATGATGATASTGAVGGPARRGSGRTSRATLVIVAAVVVGLALLLALAFLRQD